MVILLCFTGAKGVNKKTKGIYDSILKYFIEGCCQNAEEQESIRKDIEYIGSDFTDIFWISDMISGITRDKNKNEEFGIYSLISKLHDDFPEYILVRYNKNFTLFRKSDMWLMRYLIMLRDKHNVDIPDKLIVWIFKIQVIGDDELQYYQNYKSPSKKKVDKIYYYEN